MQDLFSHFPLQYMPQDMPMRDFSSLGFSSPLLFTWLSLLMFISNLYWYKTAKLIKGNQAKEKQN